MIGNLLDTIVPYFVGALGLIVAFFGYMWKTRKDIERAMWAERKADAAIEYVKDRKDIDHAKPVDTVADNARDRLRKRQYGRDR